MKKLFFASFIAVALLTVFGGVEAQTMKSVSPSATVSAVSLTPARVAPVGFSRVYLQTEGSVTPTVIGVDSPTTAPVDFKKVVIQTALGKSFVLNKGIDDGAPLDLGAGTLSSEAFGAPIYVQASAAVKVSANKIFVQDQEVKVMPDAASEVAVARLGDLDFKIELKDVGQPNSPRAVYEVWAVRPVKLIGLIPVDLPVRFKIDAETGASTPVVSPWWRFFTR